MHLDLIPNQWSIPPLCQVRSPFECDLRLCVCVCVCVACIHVCVRVYVRSVCLCTSEVSALESSSRLWDVRMRAARADTRCCVLFECAAGPVARGAGMGLR
jgi:hypothetical protein